MKSKKIQIPCNVYYLNMALYLGAWPLLLPEWIPCIIPEFIGSPNRLTALTMRKKWMARFMSSSSAWKPEHFKTVKVVI